MDESTVSFGNSSENHQVRILFIYCLGGGGHQANLRSFQRAVQDRHLPWLIESHNLYDIIESRYIENLYNDLLQRGMTWHWGKIAVPLFKAGFTLIKWDAHRKLERFFRSVPHKPDIIITNIQVTAQRIGTALQRMDADIPLMVFINDHAEVKDNTFRWGFPVSELSYPTYFVCPNEKTRSEILQYGHSEERVLLQRGVGIDERCARPLEPFRRRSRKQQLGFTDDPVVLLSFGGVGNRIMRQLVPDVLERCPNINVIALCGRDEETVKALQPFACQRLHLCNYVDDVSLFLGVTDVFVGKPGPGSVTEAVAMGAGIVTINNKDTMRQEENTVRWVQDHGFGEIITDWQELPEAISRVLVHLGDIRKRSMTMQNHAMADCIDHVNRILTVRKKGSVSLKQRLTG